MKEAIAAFPLMETDTKLIGILQQKIENTIKQFQKQYDENANKA